MNRRLQPEYWADDPNPHPGLQAPHREVAVQQDRLLNHTAIIAQSGSGKSFFLGRLIEEIVSKTEARCLVFDPNSDFRRIFSVVPKEKWETAHYNSKAERDGFLATEKSRAEFLAQWPADSITVRLVAPTHKHPFAPIGLAWPDVSMRLLAEDLHPSLRGQLDDCHRFVRAYLELASVLRGGSTVALDLKLLDDIENLLPDSDAGLSESKIEEELEISLPRVEKEAADIFDTDDPDPDSVTRVWSDVTFNVATMARARVSAPVKQFYFSRTRNYVHEELIGSSYTKHLPLPPTPPGRLQVVDLPSITEKSAQLLVASGMLSSVWRRAQQERVLKLTDPNYRRQPTFIIVDEAHNLMPVGGDELGLAQRAVLEQLRTIAAEGRKFNIHLILVSQRPDKLDRTIVSECANKLIMKLDSQELLKITREVLGLEHVRILGECLDFKMGRGLMVGPWAQDGTKGIGYRKLMGAARRTEEGEVKLGIDEWNKPHARKKAAAKAKTRP